MTSADNTQQAPITEIRSIEQRLREAAERKLNYELGLTFDPIIKLMGRYIDVRGSGLRGQNAPSSENELYLRGALNHLRGVCRTLLRPDYQEKEFEEFTTKINALQKQINELQEGINQ